MADTPKIRFKGFADAWEQRKLSDVADVRDGTHASPKYFETGHPFVTSKNVKDGSINYDDVQYISDEDFEEINKRSKVDLNDILMGMIGTIGNIALIRTAPDFAIKNVALVKDTKQINYLYLYHFLQSNKTTKQLSGSLDGGTQKFISLGNIRNLDIDIPSEEEQNKLGRYFESLDTLITLHQHKCDATKELKKYMLQKMFPRNGKKNPEIRFAGFIGDWEQRKALELAEYSKGNGYSKGDLTEVGTPIILYGRLYTKYQFAIDEVDTFVIPKSSSVYSQGNEVIVPASGETAEDIARASAVEKSGVLLGGDLNILRPFDFINPLFLALAISNGEPQKALAKKAQGKSVVHIHNSDIQEVTIS